MYTFRLILQQVLFLFCIRLITVIEILYQGKMAENKLLTLRPCPFPPYWKKEFLQKVANKKAKETVDELIRRVLRWEYEALLAP